MLDKLLAITDSIFYRIKNSWERTETHKAISSILVFIFLLSIGISAFSWLGWISLKSISQAFANPFFAIEVAFTLLLIVELFSLIIVLPKSVAKSVGKQFELLSLIFLRNSFKEFSHTNNHYTWIEIKDDVLGMLVYAGGAIAIFVIMGFVYRLQKHIRLTEIEKDQTRFISIKRLLALILFVAFISLGISDILTLFSKGKYLHSFHDFYTVLIFSDIIIVLISLRYTMNYYKIFRYSSFVLATILIRISLSVEAPHNVFIGIASALFILFLTIAYNYFLRDIPEKKLSKHY